MKKNLNRQGAKSAKKCQVIGKKTWRSWRLGG
jgi:hypothetical protein